MQRNEMSGILTVADKVTLKGTVNRVFLETVLFLSIIQTYPSLLDYAEGMGKVGLELMNLDQQETFKAILCHQGNSLRDLSQAPMPNPAQSFPVTLEAPSQSN